MGIRNLQVELVTHVVVSAVGIETGRTYHRDVAITDPAAVKGTIDALTQSVLAEDQAALNTPEPVIDSDQPTPSDLDLNPEG